MTTSIGSSRCYHFHFKRLVHGVLGAFTLYILFRTTFSNNQNYRFHHQRLVAQHQTGSSRTRPQPEQGPRKTPTNQHVQHHVCPDATDYFSSPALKQSIERALEFHTRGGNLKSIQRLLDDHIDTTVQQLGAKFIPNTENAKPTQGVTGLLQDYYATHFDQRGGYGQPLPGKYMPTHPLIFENRYVAVAEPTHGRLRWDAGLGPMGPNCTNLLQVGPDHQHKDGTKWICQPMDQQAKEATATKNRDCHILSIGGNDNWQFEQSVIDSLELTGCITHTFDCTLPGGQPRQKPTSERVNFYNTCLAGHKHTDAHGREFVTYWDLLRMANITAAPPRLLKMDIEGYEYDVFAQMIQQASSPNSAATTAFTTGNKDATSSVIQQQPSTYWLPQQIQVELHWASRMTGLSWMPRTRTAAEIAILSGMMFTGGGYMPIFQDWIPQCTSCMEVLFFKALCY